VYTSATSGYQSNQNSRATWGLQLLDMKPRCFAGSAVLLLLDSQRCFLPPPLHPLPRGSSSRDPTPSTGEKMATAAGRATSPPGLADETTAVNSGGVGSQGNCSQAQVHGSSDNKLPNPCHGELPHWRRRDVSKVSVRSEALGTAEPTRERVPLTPQQRNHASSSSSPDKNKFRKSNVCHLADCNPSCSPPTLLAESKCALSDAEKKCKSSVVPPCSEQYDGLVDDTPTLEGSGTHNR